MPIAKIQQDHFQSNVLQANTPVMVDFSAVWCGPCKMLDPVVAQIAQEWDGRVKFYKVDVDESPELAMQYQVMGVPTLMLFVEGAPVERMTGYSPKDKVMGKFSPHLK
jgi:thioredoxin 1